MCSVFLSEECDLHLSLYDSGQLDTHLNLSPLRLLLYTVFTAHQTHVDVVIVHHSHHCSAQGHVDARDSCRDLEMEGLDVLQNVIVD